MKPYFRKTWAEIDLDALTYNVNHLFTYHQKALIAVIKANAYGHGDVMLARHLEKLGTPMFAVASLDEALNLRMHGITTDILCMGALYADDIQIAIENNIIATVVNLDWVDTLKTVKAEGLRVHLKVDTGMNRLGIKEVEDLKQALVELDRIGVISEGIYTHFASSDNPDNIQTSQQYELFQNIYTQLNRPFKWVHCANSGAVVNFKAPCCNAVRIGLSLYGYSDYPVALKPLMTLYSTLLDIKTIHAGETVGYGATYTASGTELIGTVGIGYADGLSRSHQGSVCSLNGSLYEYVGRICMDLCMIRLDQPYPLGSKVEIIGEHIDVYAMAKHLGTIPYEIFAQLNDRIPRIYLEGGKVIATLNARFPSPDLKYPE